jgi:hypothetical protein
VAKTRPGPEGIKIIPRSPFKKELLTNHLLKDKFNPLRDQLTDFPGFLLGIREPGLKVDRLRNPFDIPRNELLDQVSAKSFLFVKIGKKVTKAKSLRRLLWGQVCFVLTKVAQMAKSRPISSQCFSRNPMLGSIKSST